jgi:2-haloacid dehalogenase
MSVVRAVVFDAYGTLLDVHAPMAALAARIGPEWRQVSADWRMKQLEYSWVRSLTGPAHHRDFWQCTQDALAWVAAKHRLGEPDLLAALLAAYRACPAYPEVPALLASLQQRGIPAAILSNGSPAMLAEATAAAGLTPLLADLLSVETIGVFKPHPLVYRLPERRFDLPAAAMAFVSANPWDTHAALAHGYRAIRLNRTAEPDEYGLRAAIPEIASLTDLPALLA